MRGWVLSPLEMGDLIRESLPGGVEGGNPVFAGLQGFHRGFARDHLSVGFVPGEEEAGNPGVELSLNGIGIRMRERLVRFRRHLRLCFGFGLHLSQSDLAEEASGQLAGNRTERGRQPVERELQHPLQERFDQRLQFVEDPTKRKELADGGHATLDHVDRALCDRLGLIPQAGEKAFKGRRQVPVARLDGLEKPVDLRL